MTVPEQVEDPGYRVAHVDADGSVTNVSLVPTGWPWLDGAWEPPEGVTLVDAETNEGAQPGGTWDGEQFHAPES